MFPFSKQSKANKKASTPLESSLHLPKEPPHKASNNGRMSSNLNPTPPEASHCCDPGGLLSLCWSQSLFSQEALPPLLRGCSSASLQQAWQRLALPHCLDHSLQTNTWRQTEAVSTRRLRVLHLFQMESTDTWSELESLDSEHAGHRIPPLQVHSRN